MYLLHYSKVSNLKRHGKFHPAIKDLPFGEYLSCNPFKLDFTHDLILKLSKLWESGSRINVRQDQNPSSHICLLGSLQKQTEMKYQMQSRPWHGLRNWESINLEATIWMQQFGSKNLDATIWKQDFGCNNLEARIWKHQFGCNNLKASIWKQQFESINLSNKFPKLCDAIASHLKLTHWPNPPTDRGNC